MVGDEMYGAVARKNPKHYWPMDKTGLYERVQKHTGTTAFPELPELAPEVLKLDAATQHWFTDRTRAAYNAGLNGQQPPARARDQEVAEAVGPANFESFYQRVFDLGRAQREAEKTPKRALDQNLF